MFKTERDKKEETGNREHIAAKPNAYWSKTNVQDWRPLVCLFNINRKENGL